MKFKIIMIGVLFSSSMMIFNSMGQNDNAFLKMLGITQAELNTAESNINEAFTDEDRDKDLEDALFSGDATRAQKTLNEYVTYYLQFIEGKKQSLDESVLQTLEKINKISPSFKRDFFKNIIRGKIDNIVKIKRNGNTAFVQALKNADEDMVKFFVKNKLVSLKATAYSVGNTPEDVAKKLLNDETDPQKIEAYKNIIKLVKTEGFRIPKFK
jgi:ankyrin repeat protein